MLILSLVSSKTKDKICNKEHIGPSKKIYDRF